LKSGSLKLLEHSGPVQACNGITLPLLIYRKMRTEKCVRHGGKINVYRVLVGKHESDHLEDQAVGGRIILNWIIKK
jgi:hypothetical protein